MDVPVWFGKDEFYAVYYLMWGYLVCWVLVSFLRVEGFKLDIKRRVIGFKHWWVKRKEEKEFKLFEGD